MAIEHDAFLMALRDFMRLHSVYLQAQREPATFSFSIWLQFQPGIKALEVSQTPGLVVAQLDQLLEGPSIYVPHRKVLPDLQKCLVDYNATISFTDDTATGGAFCIGIASVTSLPVERLPYGNALTSSRITSYFARRGHEQE